MKRNVIQERTESGAEIPDSTEPVLSVVEGFHPGYVGFMLKGAPHKRGNIPLKTVRADQPHVVRDFFWLAAKIAASVLWTAGAGLPTPKRQQGWRTPQCGPQSQ